jgi:hypothetical protein
LGIDVAAVVAGQKRDQLSHFLAPTRPRERAVILVLVLQPGGNVIAYSALKQARLLATELAMTRRRVNVLEHVVIPELRQTIRFIFDKLAEAERDNISRLMKITDIIRA